MIVFGSNEYFACVLYELKQYINPKCPECGSEGKKNGIYKYKGEKRQKFKCKICGNDYTLRILEDILEKLVTLNLIGFDRSFLNSIAKDKSRSTRRKIKSILQNKKLKEVIDSDAYYNKTYLIEK